MGKRPSCYTHTHTHTSVVTTAERGLLLSGQECGMCVEEEMLVHRGSISLPTSFKSFHFFHNCQIKIETQKASHKKLQKWRAAPSEKSNNHVFANLQSISEKKKGACGQGAGVSLRIERLQGKKMGGKKENINKYSVWWKIPIHTLYNNALRIQMWTKLLECSMTLSSVAKVPIESSPWRKSSSVPGKPHQFCDPTLTPEQPLP